MKKYSTKRKFAAALSWLLVAACMGVIFYLSHQRAEESAELSMSVMGLVGKILSGLVAVLGHDGFRTLAHGLEYCGLGALLFHAFWQSTGSSRPFLSLGVAVLYALSDEIHQIFVPGRAFQISDIAVDAAGAAIGIAACVLLYKIVLIIISRGKSVEKE